jgi:hypothetical protein
MCSKVGSKSGCTKITLSISDIKVKKVMFSHMWVKKQDEDMIRQIFWICMNRKCMAQTIDGKFLS